MMQKVKIFSVITIPEWMHVYGTAYPDSLYFMGACLVDSRARRDARGELFDNMRLLYGTLTTSLTRC